MRQFPQELTDKVVDHSTDNKALKTCGLVCKAWLPRSRYHLFSRVILTAQNLTSFVDLIDSSSLPLLPFVRYLKLEYAGVALDVVYLSRLHRCPNLTSIAIEILEYTTSPTEWLDWDELLQTHIRSWSDNASSLVCFDLKFGVSMPPLHTIVNLMSCIPSVETLKIDGISAIANASDTYPSYAPTRLAHLDIVVIFDDAASFFHWLLSLPVLPILKSLKYQGQFLSGAQSLKTLIQRAGVELQSLTLHILSVDESTYILFTNTYSLDS